MKITKHYIQSESQNFFSLIIFILSIYIVIALLIDLVFNLPVELSKLIHYIDFGVCVFFFGEFCIRLAKSKDKLQYLKWGWTDLLSSIPSIHGFEEGAWFRYFRIFRVVRAFRSLRYFYHTFYKHRVRNTFETAFILIILMLIFSTIIILEVEGHAPNGNIKTAEDALWWAIVTITTVGYGDYYPVTLAGRIVAILLMFVGVGLFSLLSAFFLSNFIQQPFTTRRRRR